VSKLTGGRQRFDRNGAIAAKARIDRRLLDDLLRDPYYRQKPPKTAGREQYGREFVTRMKQNGARVEDLIATATALTAATIAMAVHRFAPGASDLIAAGGGVHNPQLMAQLQALLPELSFSTVADHGINVDAKEAVAFAILAYESFHRRPANLPSATGARHPAILGKLSLPPIQHATS
jgi:anhydro-N-acetylmuramic acid kinase